MRRSAAAAALALALAASVASGAGARGESAPTVKVPAPAVGQSKLELFTIKVSGPKHGHPTVKLTNGAALGQGFGGVVVLGRLKKQTGHAITWKAYVLMYMGNLSASPAGTANLQVTPPAGDTASTSSPEDESKDCKAAMGIEGHLLAPLAFSVWFLTAIGESPSDPPQFIDNVVPTLCH